MKDIEQIKRHLAALSNAEWLGSARRWWPRYVFHFTDMENAVNVLKSGKLVCRNTGSMFSDNASAQVIAQTDDRWKQYVRLYFRPKTPTQFHNEGFRPKALLTGLQAHCPAPVFFLFDSEQVLTLEKAQFSDGNAGSPKVRIGKSANFLEAIPFQYVYHNSWMNESEKRKIIYHRCAEVLIPGELGLSSLRGIGCRTKAELRTLRHLLSVEAWQTFYSRIKVARQLFNLRWTFVENAELEQQKITLHFNPSTVTPKPFLARLEVKDLASKKIARWENSALSANDVLRIRLPQQTIDAGYELRFTLDGALAYADTFEPLVDIPF